jgi:beta-glucosidase
MTEQLQLQPDSRQRAESLLSELSLAEKLGQLVQVNGEGALDDLKEKVVGGLVGSIINEVDPERVGELQRIATTESPHGIPLLIGRDVIHGFKTVLPIPLGLAATWNENLVRQGAQLSAVEASSQGVNWTFSPMLDVSRDPRWGRIAESFGEDPYLTGRMGSAMVRGYQNGSSQQLMSCVKHFVGYGASESGKDYNTTNIPEVELRNVYLPPFLAAIDAGTLSLMPSFSDLNGMPPSGNGWLLRKVLREEWDFQGFIVSDWESITQLSVHGVTDDARAAAQKALEAGVNMDMVSGAYRDHAESLIEDGSIDIALVDELVCEILAAKYQLGLFDRSEHQYNHAPRTQEADRVAKQLAIESTVLLKNDNHLLPLDSATKVALIGPLADEPFEQLGTWTFDGDVERSVSLRQALEARTGDRVVFASGLRFSRDKQTDLFDEARAVAEKADVVIVALGEEAILSGEAHCRADISLPGAQVQLLECLKSVGKPIVAIVMAGRPLVLEPVVREAGALLYAWHPGSMGGPALVELLYGDQVPSGRLPVTMPRSAGQIPIYYAQGNTGKPATPETVISIEEIDARAPQFSVGNTSFHLDVHPSPEFSFGFGLSYTDFNYENLRVEQALHEPGASLIVAVDVTNIGERDGIEIVQLYVKDVVASITRPVRELKSFARVPLAVGEARSIRFELGIDELSFFNGEEQVTEPGVFRIWVGGNSDADLSIDTSVYSAAIC